MEKDKYFESKSATIDPLGFFNPLLGDSTSILPVEYDEYQPYGPILEMFGNDQSSLFLSGAAGTGKTRGILEKIFLIADNFPNARIAITRKKRVDLTNSALVTWENFVLPKNHPARKGATRAHRRTYFFPNGSEVEVFGLQDVSQQSSGPQKLTSTEWDLIFINEINECDYADFTTAQSRMRGAATPYRQILGDFNPVLSTHWIYRAASKGEVAISHTVHHDNPRWFRRDDNGNEFHPVSGEPGFWTVEGQEYVNDILSKLTGNARKRFFLGEPITPDEIVYKEFDPSMHISGAPQSRYKEFSLLLDLQAKIENGERTREEVEATLERDYDWIISGDWGQVHPASIQCWAVDSDRNMRHVCEYFRTGSRTDVAAEEFLTFCGWSWNKEAQTANKMNEPPLGFSVPIRLTDGSQNCTVVTDHDPESRELFYDATGLEMELAVKALTGIETVRGRLANNRISWDDIEPIGGYDIVLASRIGHPKRTLDEFMMYKYRVTSTTGMQQVPVKKFDDGLDAARYAVALEDKVPETEKYSAKDIVNAASVNPDIIFSTIAKINRKGEGTWISSY